MTGKERRSQIRRPASGRFMAKTGLDHDSCVGYVDALNISPGGIAVRPDLTVFECVYSDFMPGKTIIMIGQNPWNRRFSLSGTVVWIKPVNDRPDGDSLTHTNDGYAVGIRINSTTSDEFFRKWIEHGTPEPR